MRRVMIQFKHVKYYGDHYRVFIDDRKRTVQATFCLGTTTVSGIAKCHPDDEFIADTGLRLALNRCAIKVTGKLIKESGNVYESVGGLLWGYMAQLTDLKKEAKYIYEHKIKN